MSTDYLLEKKIEIQIDVAVKKIINEINTLKNSLNEINNEVLTIKKTLAQNHLGQNHQIQKEKNIISNQPLKQEVEKEATLKELFENMPRLCQKNPIDPSAGISLDQPIPNARCEQTKKIRRSNVSIEKIFYCGNK